MTDTQNPLTLYNSLTRKKEPFVPQDPKRVTMYNCGPTVYSYAHIGNARAAVVADVLFRVLRHIYGEDHVVYARNITDVDDKIIEAALEQGVDISVITEKFAKIYQDDLEALNCLKPNVEPKATEHIQEMADLIITLMDKKIAYESEGHILFSPKAMDADAVLRSSDRRYGDLSNRSLDDNLAGARVEVAGYKKDPEDFVLWKPAKDGEPGWSQQESSATYRVDWRKYGNRPFAVRRGRPGWHIECSAMAKATLGETIDIHCGGIDLKFPHHENEIAQSECANEKTFSKFWVHNEFLNMGTEKMSKSLGNVTLVHDLLKDWDGEVIRLALLKAHYRSELSWSEDLLKESKANLDGLYRILYGRTIKFANFDVADKKIDKLFTGYIAEDLDLITAVDCMIGYAAEFNHYVNLYDEGLNASSEKQISKMKNYHFGKFQTALTNLYLSSNILGLLQKDPEEWFKGGASSDDQSEFDAIALRRQEARAAKDWAAADAARDEATAKGIVLEDGPDGTTWRKA